MASLISAVNQFGWAMLFSLLFHRYLKIKNVSKNFVPAVNNIISVLKQNHCPMSITQLIHKFLGIKAFYVLAEKGVNQTLFFAKSDLCSVEPLLLEGDPTFQYSLFVYKSFFLGDLSR